MTWQEDFAPAWIGFYCVGVHGFISRSLAGFCWDSGFVVGGAVRVSIVGRLFSRSFEWAVPKLPPHVGECDADF